MPGPGCSGSLIMGFIAGALAGAAGGLLLPSKLERVNPEITPDRRGRYRDRSGRYVANPNNSNPGRAEPEAPDTLSTRRNTGGIPAPSSNSSGPGPRE